MSLMPGTLFASDDRPAVVEPGAGAVSYAHLDETASRVADRLKALGVSPGARVGIYLRRSADAIGAMLGVLRASCVYVPVDPRAPVDRIAESHVDCAVQTTFVEDRFEPAYRDAMRRLGGGDAAVQRLGPVGLGRAVDAWATSGSGSEGVTRQDGLPSRPDIACLLYTSGTTGQPKAWMMSRKAIAAHAAWSHRLLAPTRDDVYANHAQFNFGMSLFDIYSSLGCGAALVLVPDQVRQHAPSVADLIARERVSIWFSAPAILSLIAEMDGLESRDLGSLRILAFAGEVFPLARLNALRRRLPHPRYFNFYGSTEANVAAFWELPSIGDLTEPPPIGRLCEHYEARIVGEDGRPAPPGAVGELQLRGGGLAAGYWRRPGAGLTPAADGGEPWFRTSDRAVERSTGDLRFAGRIGRMIKVRGYRVEPGEIEARLYQHAAIKEAAVVPAETESGPALVAHVSTTTGERPSIVELKEFCAGKLPAYMIPARFTFHASLPKTLRGKIDLQGLRAGRSEVSTG